MWRWFFLLTIILLCPVGLSPVHAGGDPNGAPCVTPTDQAVFPYTVTTERGPMECLTIESVTATFSNTVPVSVDLHISGQRWQQMDRYQIQIDQWRTGDDLYLAIYRDVSDSPSGTPLAVPYTTTVRLDEPFDPGSVQVHVNQYTVEIAIPDAPPPGADLPPSDQYPASDHATRRYPTIQHVEVLAQARRPILHVTGYDESCPGAPLQVDQRREDDWVFVELYHVQEPSCLGQRNRLDEYVRLDWALSSGSYVLQVNDYITTLAWPLPYPAVTRLYATINHVEVLTSGFYPGSMVLHVTGSYSQSCQGTLQIDQQWSGSLLTVDIYQDVDPAILCAQYLTPLDEYITVNGWFYGGTVTIRVNDYTLTYPYPYYNPPYPPLYPPVPLPN